MNVRRLVVGAALAGAVLAPQAAASAQTAEGGPYDLPTAEVKGTQFETRPTEVAGVQSTRTLPVTGGDVAGLTVLGLAFIGVGTVLVRRGRPQPIPARA
jgi:LPXTG-motif cell wall-anchored protein